MAATSGENDALIVFCTAGNKAEAAAIARTVVEERLAACGNILPEVHSIYRWQGRVEEADEVLLLLKTTTAKFEALRDRIRELHSYETPEVLAVRVEDGLPAYVSWIHESL